MARRIAALGTPESLALLVGELGHASGSARRLSILVGIEEALRGRRQVTMPTAWPDVFKILGSDSDANVRSRAVALGLNFGDPTARESVAARPRRLERPLLACGSRRWPPSSR